MAAQWLQRDGMRRDAAYRPGPLRQVVQRYPLAGLQEDLPWQRDFAPCFDLPPNVARMAQHAFTELLNNAIDHSGGTQVTVSVRQTALHLQLLVSDDGVGVFERIQQNFDIADPTLAMLELSKGKLTSAPDRHSGHGLFFSVAAGRRVRPARQPPRVPVPRLGPPQLARRQGRAAPGHLGLHRDRARHHAHARRRAARAQRRRRRLRLRHAPPCRCG